MIVNVHAAIFWTWIAFGCLGLWWEMHLFLQGKHGAPELIERALADTPSFIALAIVVVLLGPVGVALIVVTFAAGWLPTARSRFDSWRLELGFRRAQRRMLRCKHARTMMTDSGMGLHTPKCLDCWALHMDAVFESDGDGFWTPNSASPREARRMTEKLQRGCWCIFCGGEDIDRRTLYGGEGPDQAAEQWTCRDCGAGTWLYCDGTHAPWQPGPS